MADDYNKKSLEDIAKLLNDIASPLQSVASAISNMIVEADSLNRAFGGGRVRIEEMNYAIKDSVSSIINLVVIFLMLLQQWLELLRVLEEM